MNTRNNFIKPIIISLIIGAFILIGFYVAGLKLQLITQPPTETLSIKEQLAAQTRIKKFKDYDQMREFLGANTYTTGYSYGLGRGIPGAVERLAQEMPAPTAQKSVADSAGLEQDYSKTNVQVQGVGEGDIIKTDGKYIYALSRKNLFIIDAFPGQGAEILSKITFKSTPQGIYLNDDKLVVYGLNDNIDNYPIYKRFPRRRNYIFLKVFDVSDPKNPQQVRDLDFEGNYINSRMIGDYVYLITATQGDIWIDEVPVPRILDNGKDISGYHPDVYYFDIPYQSSNLTTVAVINIQDSNQEPKSEVYLLSGNQNLFVSQQNIYITYTKRVSEYQLSMEVMQEIVFPRLSQKDQERVAQIRAAANFILSPQEKMNKINYIIERYLGSLPDDDQDKLEREMEQKLKQKYQDIAKELEKTVIHKIAIDQDRLEYQTFGQVPGTVLNQFSMDEDDGYFRIATTKNRVWRQFLEDQQESYSNLYILNDDLETVGKVEKLAIGERIYSVRFMQDRAYLVTFKQVDPLFLIDVANPRQPKVLGELKIPGFSNYLHPYDQNTLIGLGRDTKENESGRVTTGGIKLSLFDVSHVSQPREIDNYILGDRNTYSIALDDHHAFLFSKDKNLLVIPVESRGSIPRPLPLFEQESTTLILPGAFGGAAVFRISPDGFELKGKINHRDGMDKTREGWYGHRYYDTIVKRSLYIDDILYTFSNKYLKLNQLTDLSSIKKLELKKEAEDDFQVVN